MYSFRTLRATLTGLALFTTPTMLSAETLSVLRGDICTAIEIPENRTITVESVAEFAELVVANPSIADISSLSSQLVLVSGVAQGRTTITFFDFEGETIGITEVIVTPDSPNYISAGRILLPNLPPVETMPVPDGTRIVTLTIRSGVSLMLRSDVPFVGIEKSNRDIVDAGNVSETNVYLLGKTLGKATLTLMRDDGRPATVIELTVVPNMADLAYATCLNTAETS